MVFVRTLRSSRRFTRSGILVQASDDNFLLGSSVMGRWKVNVSSTTLTHSTQSTQQIMTTEKLSSVVSCLTTVCHMDEVVRSPSRPAKSLGLLQTSEAGSPTKQLTQPYSQ